MDSNDLSRTSLEVDFQQHNNQQQYVINLQQNMQTLKMTQNMCEELVRKLHQYQLENGQLKTANIQLQQKINDLTQQINYLKQMLLKEKDSQYQLQIKTHNTIMHDKLLDLTKRNEEVEKKVYSLTQQLQKSEYKIIKLTRQKHEKIEKNLKHYFQFGKASPSRQRASHNVSHNGKYSNILERMPMQYNEMLQKQRQKQRQLQKYKLREKQMRKEYKLEKLEKELKLEREKEKSKSEQLHKEVRALKWKLAEKQQEIMFMIRRNKMLQDKNSFTTSSHPNSYPNTISNKKIQKYQRQHQQKERPSIEKQRSKRNFKKLLDQDRFYTCQTEPNKAKHF